jgi:hypothetical protein
MTTIGISAVVRYVATYQMKPKLNLDRPYVLAANAWKSPSVRTQRAGASRGCWAANKVLSESALCDHIQFVGGGELGVFVVEAV